jgi:competence protein ComFA
MSNFVCARCHTADPKFLGVNKDGTMYCRRCLSFKGNTATYEVKQPTHISLKVPYKFTADQRTVSKAVLTHLRNGKNVFIYAVCGAGKTELVYQSIYEYLKAGKRVGFVVPRREVVKEIYARLLENFVNIKIACVFGGHTDVINADLVIATTHQLYRYSNYFDLIIMDEIDAFPYKNNPLLFEFFKGCQRSNFILMSATPSNEELDAFKKEGGEVVTLFRRFHRHLIPVPQLCILNKTFSFIYLVRRLQRYQKDGKRVFIFSPTIKDAEALFKKIYFVCPYGAIVHSKIRNRTDLIEQLKNNELTYLVTTSILERGVTISGLQVIITMADHDLFTTAALIQIAGRVGRKKDAPSGDVIFLAPTRSPAMEEAKHAIEQANYKSFL